MVLAFKEFTAYKEGLIYSLLKRSYEELTAEMPDLASKWQQEWKIYDKKIFQFPKTIGASGFITMYNEKIIGFGSYDLRQGPELGIVGHNCILPEYRGNGFGKAQILKIISIFKELGVKKVKVTTGEHPFFSLAQKMYDSCGFKETCRYNSQDLEFRQIDYILEI
ncbi:MAG: GNAT family N-acetyltransferase [Promethearchaeota archaeon]